MLIEFAQHTDGDFAVFSFQRATEAFIRRQAQKIHLILVLSEWRNRMSADAGYNAANALKIGPEPLCGGEKPRVIRVGGERSGGRSDRGGN